MTKAGRLAETIRQIREHLRQAVALAKTLRPQVLELRRDGDWDPGELETSGAETGLLAMGLAAYIVCSAWQSAGTRAKLDRSRALAENVPVKVSTAALANIIIDHGRWTTSVLPHE